MSEIQLAIIGAGAMGRGIAETAASNGLQAVVIEVDAAQRQAARETIRQSVERRLQRGKLTASSVAEVVDRLTWADDISAVGGATFVIEAVPEIEALKIQVLRRLDEITPSNAILATNTSSISVTRLAAATGRPEKVVGMHFFNPVPVMAPVEIVRGLATADETIATTRALAERLGKQALVVQDSPGFVVNRILLPLINEAILTLQEGLADAATIDTLMKLGCNHPMGPLQLADFVGLDICLSVLRVLHREFGDPKFCPAPLLVRLVDAGRLGRKTKRGFYEYD